jgi:hypothetical protein
VSQSRRHSADRAAIAEIGRSSSTHVVVNPCNGADFQRWNSRHWSLAPDGHITAALGGCLTVLGGPDPGTAVGSRTCGGGPEQGWDSVP